MNENADLTLWEILDVAASRESICATGFAVGFGPGLVVPKPDFDANHRSQGEHGTGATRRLGGTSNDATPPRARASWSERQEAKAKAKRVDEEKGNEM